MRKKKELPEGIVQNDVEWKVNTAALIKEIGSNNVMGFLSKALMIFMHILAEVGEEAARINDPVLNGLMCRLAIYEISDPYSGHYDKELLEEVMKEYKAAKKKLKNDTKGK